MIYLKLTLLYTIILFVNIFISKRLGFVDIPNKRKLHTHKILNTSGVALYFYLVIIVSSFELIPELEEVIILGSFILMCGFIDDRINLSPSVKLFLTFIPVFYLIDSGLVLDDLGVYEFIGKINLGKFSFIFTLLGCALLIHSYNYIDGVDGLLIAITISNILFALFLIDTNNQEFIQLMLFIMIPLIINLFFNFLGKTNPLKIFMGNSGSLFVGFFISFVIIYLYLYENIHPSILIWMCWYPIFDFLFVTILRMKKKIKFYKPDMKHFHHSMIQIFDNSHIKSTGFIFFLNLIITSLGYLTSNNLGNIYSIIFFNILFLVYSILRVYLLKKF